MSTIGVSPVIALLAVGLVGSCAHPDAAHPKSPIQTPLTQNAARGDLLVVVLRSETGEQLRFIVDTGSPATLLDDSLAATLGKRMGTKKIFWSGGKAVLDVYPAPKLYLGNIQLQRGQQVMTFDLKKLNYPGSPIMGVLGMDCLRNYCIQLDFKAANLAFLDPDALRDKDLGKAFPLILSRSCFAIADNLVGTKGRTLIDTGCNFDGVLTPALFQQWTNISSTNVKLEARFPNGVLGGESYTNLDLHGDGVENLLGLPFLARHLVTLNFPRRIMYLKRYE